jgi:hypothetical protein
MGKLVYLFIHQMASLDVTNLRWIDKKDGIVQVSTHVRINKDGTTSTVTGYLRKRPISNNEKKPKKKRKKTNGGNKRCIVCKKTTGNRKDDLCESCVCMKLDGWITVDIEKRTWKENVTDLDCVDE